MGNFQVVQFESRENFQLYYGIALKFSDSGATACSIDTRQMLYMYMIIILHENYVATLC